MRTFDELRAVASDLAANWQISAARRLLAAIEEAEADYATASATSALHLAAAERALKARDDARATTLAEAAREVCFKCQSPQLFPLDPSQHGRYHVPAADLERPIADRRLSSCDGAQVLRLFMRPLFPDVCGAAGCPLCAAMAKGGGK